MRRHQMVDREENADVREVARGGDTAPVQRADETTRAVDETDFGTALEGKPESTVAGGPGGGSTVGAGRGEPELGNMGNVGTPPDNTLGSEAGLGGGSGDPGAGGGLGDDLGTLSDEEHESAAEDASGSE